MPSKFNMFHVAKYIWWCHLFEHGLKFSKEQGNFKEKKKKMFISWDWLVISNFEGVLNLMLGVKLIYNEMQNNFTGPSGPAQFSSLKFGVKCLTEQFRLHTDIALFWFYDSWAAWSQNYAVKLFTPKFTQQSKSQNLSKKPVSSCPLGINIVWGNRNVEFRFRPFDPISHEYQRVPCILPRTGLAPILIK